MLRGRVWQKWFPSNSHGCDKNSTMTHKVERWDLVQILLLMGSEGSWLYSIQYRVLQEKNKTQFKGKAAFLTLIFSLLTLSLTAPWNNDSFILNQTGGGPNGPPPRYRPNQAFPFSFNSTSCTMFNGLKISFIFSWTWPGTCSCHPRRSWLWPWSGRPGPRRSQWYCKGRGSWGDNTIWLFPTLPDKVYTHFLLY